MDEKVAQYCTVHFSNINNTRDYEHVFACAHVTSATSLKREYLLSCSVVKLAKWYIIRETLHNKALD